MQEGGANKKYQIEFQKGTAGMSVLVFIPARCTNLIRAVKHEAFFLSVLVCLALFPELCARLNLHERNNLK